jgi:hypothetical protein|tara:strand:+ start:2550 stop:2813 length:264 start_codon:yes stop_codon:yes gene_type:complete
MTKTEIDLINEHHSDAVIETFLAPKLWRSVVTDAVVYDPLTGNYNYKVQNTDTYNEYWTPMGQPRRDTIENKEKSPRKEKKKKPKPK